MNVRLVRVSGLVVAPALLALLFSVSTPGTLPRPPIEPLFDEVAATAIATQLSADFPARVPGTDESAAAARWFEQTISAAGLRTETQAWLEVLPDLGRVELRNVVAVIPGRSPETIVVVAHRDNVGADRPLGDNASGTAALVELGRGFGPQSSAPAPLPARTLVLVSTDAGAYGGAGAAHFATTSPYAETALVAVVLDGIGGPGRPHLAIAGDRPASPARVLVSTASSRIAEHTGDRPELPSVPEQLANLAVPLAVGEQGRFLARGTAAVTVTTKENGDPNVPVGDPDAPLSTERLGQLGRATEALIGSVDASVGAAFRTPDSLFFGDRVASGWALRLTLVILVAPFALGVADLLARGRRQRLRFRPALRALRARALFWLYGALLLWVGSVAGILPTGAALPLPPYSESIVGRSAGGVGLLVTVFAAGWLLARRRLVPVAGAALSTEDRLGGYSVALGWLGLAAFLGAIGKPYALAFLLPSLYAWLWLPLQTRRLAAVALYALGLAGPLVGFLVVGRELGLGPIDTAVYLAALASVGYVSVATVLLAVAWAAAAAQVGALVLGRYGVYAGGAERPPPGAVRRSVRALAQTVRGFRYARET